jgi:hypothetical protein
MNTAAVAPSADFKLNHYQKVTLGVWSTLMASASSDLPPLIRAMLRREFYPHETADEIRLVQTHISYLLLRRRRRF